MQDCAHFGNGHCPVTRELLSQCNLSCCAVQAWPSAFSAPCPCRFQACHRSLLDEVAVHMPPLGHRRPPSVVQGPCGGRLPVCAASSTQDHASCSVFLLCDGGPPALR